MKRFQFKFATVQKVRKIQEDEALRDLGHHQRVYLNEINKKAKLVSELQAALLRRENLGNVATSISLYLGEQDFISGQKQRILHADHAIMRATRRVEKSYVAYLSARTQSKTMETLHDESYREYKKEETRTEQKKMDEIILNRFNTRKESA